MATLAVGATATFNLSPGISVNFVSSFGTNFRYSFTPTNTTLTAFQSDARSYGPYAQNITVGPFAVHGSITIVNESGSTLTYGSIVAALTEVGGLTIYGATVMTASANVTLSPTGGGTVTINPATLGNIDNCRIGFSLRNSGGFTYVAVSGTDNSGSPGPVTNNSGKGRVAIAAGSNNIVVTNTACAATTTVFAVITQASADATLTQIVRVVPAAGSFTIYGNANATANTVVDFVLLLN
jgi:hypothetical protein